MKMTSVKFSILAVVLICVSVALIGLSECATHSEDMAGYQWGGQPTQAITDDVQSFIRLKQIPQKDIEIIQYYEDYKTGRIAAVIATDNHYSWWNRKSYILYYDKNSRKTKVRTNRQKYWTY